MPTQGLRKSFTLDELEHGRHVQWRNPPPADPLGPKAVGHSDVSLVSASAWYLGSGSSISSALPPQGICKTFTLDEFEHCRHTLRRDPPPRDALGPDTIGHPHSGAPPGLGRQTPPDQALEAPDVAEAPTSGSPQGRCDAHARAPPLQMRVQ